MRFKKLIRENEEKIKNAKEEAERKEIDKQNAYISSVKAVSDRILPIIRERFQNASKQIKEEGIRSEVEPQYKDVVPNPNDLSSQAPGSVSVRICVGIALGISREGGSRLSGISYDWRNPSEDVEVNITQIALAHTKERRAVESITPEMIDNDIEKAIIMIMGYDKTA